MARILRIIALLVFALSAFSVEFGLNGVALGLAIYMGSTLVD